MGVPPRDQPTTRNAVLQTLFRAIRSYTATSNLAALSLAAPEILLPIFRERSESTLRTLASSYAGNVGLSQFLSTMREVADRSAVVGTQNAIAAACLVFSHSMADGAVEEFCLIAAIFDPAYWGSTVSSQTFTLKQIVDGGTEDLLRTSIRQKIPTMSLPTKMRHLLRNAGKHANVEHPNFSYDGKRLAELDALRHEIIHGESITLQVAMRDSQEFFFNVTVHAGLIISSMLDLGITHRQLYVEWAEDLKRQPVGG